MTYYSPVPPSYVSVSAGLSQLRTDVDDAWTRSKSSDVDGSTY